MEGMKTHAQAKKDDRASTSKAAEPQEEQSGEKDRPLAGQDLLDLQQSVGNKAVTGLIGARAAGDSTVQRAPGDGGDAPPPSEFIPEVTVNPATSAPLVGQPFKTKFEVL